MHYRYPVVITYNASYALMNVSDVNHTELCCHSVVMWTEQAVPVTGPSVLFCLVGTHAGNMPSV